MKHLCYVYIFEYKCLKDIELVLDSRYNFRFSKEEAKLSITKNEEFPSDFWGKSISSIAAIIGNNGTGKSTAMSFLLAFLVEGSAYESLKGIIVFEQAGRFYYFGKNISVVFGDEMVESVNSSIGLKDSRWKIPCFYHSGHFAPYIKNDPRNSYLAGSYFASDIIRLVEDLQDDSNENASSIDMPLSRYLNSHVAQNNYRTCMMMSNRRLSDTITKIVKDFKWPRYVIIGINRSGATAIENSLRHEKGKVIKEMQKAVEEKEKQFDNKAINHNSNIHVYEDTEDLGEMLQYDKKLLVVRDLKVFESNRLDVVSTNYSRAKLYYKQGNYDKALGCYKEALVAIESDLEKDDLDIATTCNNIAIVYNKQGDYDKALENYKRAYDIREPKLGKDNDDTFSTCYNIARMYFFKGEIDDALKYYNKLIPNSIFDYAKAISLALHNNVARAFFAKKDYTQALKFCKDALDVINYAAYMVNIMDEAITYNNIARVYYAKGDYDEALELFNNVLKYKLNKLDIAATYNNIAWVHYKKGNFDKALEYFSSAEKIRETQLGKNHLSTAKIYHSIAEVNRVKGDFENALRYYEMALKIRESELGKDHPETAKTYNDIAKAYDAMGDYDKALEYLNIIESYYLNTTIVKENSKDIPIPPFKLVFKPSSKDHYLSLLIYYNLLNIINDKWNWKNGFDIVNEWQDWINSTTPVLKQLDAFINRYSDGEKKETLKSLYDVLFELQNLTLYKNDGYGEGFLYIDCEESMDNLVNLGEKVLNSNKFYLSSKFFDLSFTQSLDSDSILSSGEQELLNLFSRLYDAIVLRPNKFSNIKIPSLLMLDEAEIGFHPDWQRKYLKLVIDFIDALKETDAKIPDFQIIISTHSPILLSDIPKCCTNYLKTGDKTTIMANRDEIGETFAENVFQLYRRSFFMEEGLVGEFARFKIKKLDERINENETNGVLNEIKMIGDDGIREFLMDKYHKKHPKDDLLNEEIIKYYQEKVDQLKKLNVYKDE